MLYLIIYSIISTIIVIILIVGLYTKNTNVICRSKRRLDGKTVLVTGGTSGMGLEIATDMAQRGAKVIVACPFEDEGKTGRELIIERSGNQNVIFDLLNLASFTSVREFAETILKRESRLDILINNGGVNTGNRLTEDGWGLVFQINYLGTVLLTFLLLPLLDKTGSNDEPSKIINTTSISHKLIKSIEFESFKLTDRPLRYYPNSKKCIAIFTTQFAKRLGGYNVVVNTIDPGIASTRIYRTATDPITGRIAVALTKYCSRTAWEGAQTAIHVAVCDKARGENGKYFFNCRVTTTLPSPEVFDDELGELLWRMTMDILKCPEVDKLNLSISSPQP